MNELKFTIVIPTKNRADTLYWALKTCVEQRYRNLDIIVSDNFSNDNTKEVALSFNDPRIKYINTGKALSMSGNWEFALSHVKEGFLSFLGDDDAFLPNAIRMLNEIANATQCDAINAPAIEYTWPNHVRPLYRNKMFFKKDNVDQYPDVKRILLKALKYEFPYSSLPWLYKGFVSIKLIKKIKEITNVFFHSLTPDVYSAIAISSVIEDKKYYYHKIPFAINGASSHSNGVSQGVKIKNEGAMEYLSSISLPFHKDLILCNSYPLYIYECYLQARDIGLFPNTADTIQLEEVLNKALNLAQYWESSLYDVIKKTVIRIGIRNNLDRMKLDNIIKKYPNKNILQRFTYKFKNRYFLENNQINMNEYGVKNVYDAALIADKILKKEIKPATKVMQTIAGDIKTILKTM